MIEYLRSQHHHLLLVEAAGLFWILAELVILYGVAIGRRHLDTEPLPERVTLTARERWLAVCGFLGFALVCVAVFGRHLLLPPAYACVEIPDLPAAQLTELLRSRTDVHLALWAGFVTVWVLLESIIVYQGWRAYRSLRARLVRGKDMHNARA